MKLNLILSPKLLPALPYARWPIL